MNVSLTEYRDGLMAEARRLDALSPTWPSMVEMVTASFAEEDAPRVTVQYEIEVLHDRYGSKDWDRTSHGLFNDEDDARQVAEHMTRYVSRIIKVETTRTAA